MRVTAIDYHTAGEPFRIVTGGVPDIAGDDVAARRITARDSAAHPTAEHVFTLDPDDELGTGFVLR